QPACRRVPDLARLPGHARAATQIQLTHVPRSRRGGVTIRRNRSMELRPIFSALLRNKAGLILIVVQVAITLAVISNSLFIVLERSERVGRPSGIDDNGTFIINSLGFAAGYDVRDAMQADQAMLRAMPGVTNAIVTNTVPMSNGGWSTTLTLQPPSNANDVVGEPAAL